MNGEHRTWYHRIVAVVSTAAALSVAGAGCEPGRIGDRECATTREYFLSNVWGPVMGRTCVNCHAPGGQAEIRGARFQLLPASYPDFADANLANIATISAISYNDNGRQMSLLLAKATGRMNHGGGRVVEEGGADYKALEGLVDRLRGSNQAGGLCPDGLSVTAAPDGVQMLDYPGTLRKAALHLVGRLPTPDEVASASAGEEGFDATLAAMIEEPAFYARFRTAFNDMLLTNRYVTGDGCNQRALNLISNDDFPNRGTYGGGATAGLDCCGADRERAECGPVREFFRQANNAVASEPINLFEHVVRNDRPFSEILTANYVLVNPMSAHVYGVTDQVQFDDANDPDEFREARVAFDRRASNGTARRVQIPHAGVLTTAAFIDRYPTTDTNRNRARARIVQSYFLATDVLKIGERPIDSTATEALIQTPTMNYGPCSTCHKINDPIAGAFRGFRPGGQTSWRFDPTDAWYTDMFPPGFNGENMPGDQYPTALQWLAPRITRDRRFVTSVLRFVYSALTGHEPLTYPADPADELYAGKAAAWVQQDRIFRAIGQDFLDHNMNFKRVVIEMVKSPLFRAVGGPATTDPARAATLAGLGTGRLLTPELLASRIRAIAGYGWTKDWSRNEEWLGTDFYLPYGGINSDTVVDRVTDASGIIVNVAARMANEVACRGAASDFTRPMAARRFFTAVEPDIVPESANSPVPASVARIKQNIVYLHQLVLGETLSADAPEVARTYQLFLETWREVKASNSNSLPYSCRGAWDVATGRELPSAMQITQDPNGSIRAWMAVLTYLFSDYRFIYE